MSVNWMEVQYFIYSSPATWVLVLYPTNSFPVPTCCLSAGAEPVVLVDLQPSPCYTTSTDEEMHEMGVFIRHVLFNVIGRTIVPGITESFLVLPKDY